MSCLLIDDRAGSRDLIDYPPLEGHPDVTLTRLNSGDVCFPGNGPDDAPVVVGVEVKTITDFVSSCATGRLQGTQLPAMLREYDVVWLLVYGEWRPSPREGHLQVRTPRGGVLPGGDGWRTWRQGTRHVPYGYVESMMTSLEVQWGVGVRWALDTRAAAEWVGCAYRWWSKPWAKHKGLRALDKSQRVVAVPGMPDDVLMRAQVASALPGVGYERAVAIARHFASVEAMVDATPGDWAQVPGIGKGLAKIIHQALRR